MAAGVGDHFILQICNFLKFHSRYVEEWDISVLSLLPATMSLSALIVGALLFGTSLIGVAVDYSLQYCSDIFSLSGKLMFSVKSIKGYDL